MNPDFLFHSNGKLLLSAEYFVLDGAKAIGLPCRYGQSLGLKAIKEDLIEWQSLTHDHQVWFRATYQRQDLKVIHSSDQKIAEVLQNILLQAQILNPDFLSQTGGFAGRTYLEFPRLWGLGSSSTLINNIAQWANVNPFKLSKLTLGGSGYDIACAAAKGPIFYQNSPEAPKIEPIHFAPSFSENLFFVYLERKQNSREGIKRYRASGKEKEQSIKDISQISEALLQSSSLENFQDLLTAHERIVSNTIGIPQVQEELFKDFGGVVKSLGAWGGDFVLAASAEEPSAIKNYFNKRGYQTFLEYNDMLLEAKE